VQWRIGHGAKATRRDSPTLFIAATAQHYGLTILSRNRRRIESLGVAVIDPLMELRLLSEALASSGPYLRFRDDLRAITPTAPGSAALVLAGTTICEKKKGAVLSAIPFDVALDRATSFERKRMAIGHGTPATKLHLTFCRSLTQARFRQMTSQFRLHMTLLH